MVKNLPANAGDAKDVDSILGLKDPLGKEMGTNSSILQTGCKVRTASRTQVAGDESRGAVAWVCGWH